MAIGYLIQTGMYTVKILKLRTPKTVAVILKFEQCGLILE